MSAGDNLDTPRYKVQYPFVCALSVLYVCVYVYYIRMCTVCMHVYCICVLYCMCTIILCVCTMLYVCVLYVCVVLCLCGVCDCVTMSVCVSVVYIECCSMTITVNSKFSSAEVFHSLTIE